MPSVIVDFPVKLPARCSSCSSPYSRDGRKYVDTNIDVRKYGRIYICTLCFSEIALKLGYSSAALAEAQQAALFANEERITALEEENDRLNTIISGGLAFLRAMDERANAKQINIDVTPSGEGFTADDSGRADEESVVHPTARERVTTVGESGSAEPSEVSGSSDLSTPLKINL